MEIARAVLMNNGELTAAAKLASDTPRPMANDRTATVEIGIRQTSQRCSRSFSAIGGRDEPAVPAPQDEASQPSAGKGAGIDVDAMRPVLRKIANRVAMDDHLLRQRHPAAQEFVPDPQQVGWHLLVERHARPNTRMHEQIVPHALIEGAAAQEFDVTP